MLSSIDRSRVQHYDCAIDMQVTDDAKDSAQSIDRVREARRVEALKSLADWSKWIISIQAISGVVFLSNSERSVLEPGGELLLRLALFFVLLSILAATLLVGGIPGAIVEETADESTEASKPSIYDNRVWTELPFRGLSFRFLAFFEHLGFALAVICVGLAYF
ncbi:MAG: hypothetical protein AAFX44_18495 [Pseudomonadota bacterium]